MVLTFLVSIRCPSTAQVRVEPGDPPNPTDIPGFFVSTLVELEKQVTGVRKGEVEIIARSPGGLPVYAVSYGEREDPHTRANYNSAVTTGLARFTDRRWKGSPVC